MSKTFIMCMCLLFVFVIMIHKGNKDAKKKLAKKALIIIGAVALAMAVCMPKLFISFLGRFFVADPTSGRMGLLAKFNGFIFSSFKNIFFGTGISSLRPTIDVYFGEAWTQVPHNGIQEIIVVWGIPGLILFGWFIWLFINSARKNLHNQKLINYIPLILLIIKVQLGQLVTSYYTMLMLGLCYVSLCYDFEDENTTDFRVGIYLKFLQKKCYHLKIKLEQKYRKQK